jgi:hypothetical protein
MIQHLSDDELIFEASADDINEFISSSKLFLHLKVTLRQHRLSVALTKLLLHT